MNSLVILGILIIYSIYRLSITDEAEWITTYLPLILICILFVTVLVNVVLMIRYTLFVWKNGEN